MVQLPLKAAKAPQLRRQHRFISLCLPLSSLPIPSRTPRVSSGHVCPWGAAGMRAELYELEELGSSCTGSSFCLRAKLRDPQSLSSSIPLLSLSKKHFTECLKEGG